jgi:LysR family transcriptional regulator, transcriptional activator of nhaA
MEWLNYHHLLYFWTVIKEGGLTPASSKLHLAPSTLSGQLHTFQAALGEKLLVRKGKKLELTEIGRIVYEYADEIFRLGNEMLDTVRDRPTGKPINFMVGVVDAISKQIVKKLLSPIKKLKLEIRLSCREGRLERLVPELALHNLDMLIVDTPVPPSTGFRVFNHLLIDSGISLIASPTLVSRLKDKPLRNMSGAPFILTTSNSAQRRGIDEWFMENKIIPQIVAEFEDSALLAEYGQDGSGIFEVPTQIERDVCRQLGLKLLLRLPHIRERYYAVTAERRIDHPAINAIFNVYHKNE